MVQQRLWPGEGSELAVLAADAVGGSGIPRCLLDYLQNFANPGEGALTSSQFVGLLGFPFGLQRKLCVC